MVDDILVYDMVAHSLHNSWAIIATLSKWRAHIRGNEAEDISKCHLKIMYLVDNFCLVDRAEIRVSPSMSCNLSPKLSATRTGQKLTRWQYLMSFTVHATDHIRPASFLNIDLTFAQIVAGDEECGFGAVGRQYIQQVRRIVVGTVIESQSQ